MLKRIDRENEQITFHYNSHSNVDLFVDYGFVLEENPFNSLNIVDYLSQLLNKEQIEILKSFDYWRSLEIYLNSNEISWTILKSIDLFLTNDQWSPFDEPSIEQHKSIQRILLQLLQQIRRDIDEDFSRWTNQKFQQEKIIFHRDFHQLIEENILLIQKLFR